MPQSPGRMCKCIDMRLLLSAEPEKASDCPSRASCCRCVYILKRELSRKGLYKNKNLLSERTKQTMKKGTAGFTLVELIVVIAILAILAGIAIPTYSGYIAKAQEAADLLVLDSVKTAATFAAMDKNVTAKVTKIEVTDNSGTATIAVTYSYTDSNGAAQTNGALDTAAVTPYTGTVKLKYITACNWTETGWEVTAHK